MNKQKKTFYTILGVIGDWVFFPVIIISLIVCMFVFVDRRQEKIPSVMGYSMVRILSGSMKNSGFLIGENVFVKSTKANNLWEGDIIAFYSKYDKIDDSIEFVKLETVNQDIIIADPKVDYAGRTPLEIVQKARTKVIFHEIIGVYVDDNGTRFFETKGSSNSIAENKYVREDYVVGRYVTTPKFVRVIIQFVCSPLGMILLVCIPLGILVILQSLSLIEQINFILIEKKLLKGLLDWKEKEVQLLIKSGDMENIAKVICFGNCKAEERKQLADCLWSFVPKKQTFKEQDYMRKVGLGIKTIENDVNAYWLFWKNNTTNKRDYKILEQFANIS